MNLHIRATLTLLLLGVPVSAQVTYDQAKPEVIKERLATVVRDNKDREAALYKLFQEVGCGDRLSLQPVAHSKLHNVVCVLPGKNPQQIVVGAHFDHVEMGMGVADNWTGASLLPSFYEGLKSKPRQHTLVFVGFADEEKGMVGSKHYVEQLKPEEREQIDAMVNMDSLGLEKTKIWVTAAAPVLVKLAAAVAASGGFEIKGSNVDGVGSTDSESFRAKDVPAITFHSIVTENLRVLHSVRDNKEAIKQTDLYESYRFLTAYLAVLDAQEIGAVRKFAKKDPTNK
jgi:putative aminopeptidase FrvX